MGTAQPGTAWPATARSTYTSRGREMKIRLTTQVYTAAGSGKQGDVVDWPEATCRALIDGKCAVLYKPEKPKATAGRKGDD